MSTFISALNAAIKGDGSSHAGLVALIPLRLKRENPSLVIKTVSGNVAHTSKKDVFWL